MRGAAEPRDFWPTEKGNRSYYQFKVFVCVSLISGRMRIIARMRSIGVLIVNRLIHQESVDILMEYCS